MAKIPRNPANQAAAEVNGDKDGFWQDLIEPKVEKVRLGLDISKELDSRLTAKAKELKQSKSELVRKLIEWGLDRD